ncbi:MAG: ketol-acid reductoisomerase [Opitutales bacterium]
MEFHQPKRNMPAKVYTDKDADLKVIKQKTLAIIGYGSQGHAHAQNLKESGLNVIIGLYPKSKSVKVAKSQGFEVYETAEAVKKADVIMLAVPDMKQPEIYEKDILPNLEKGKTLAFTHGLAIHYGLIEPPKGVNVIMIAPKGPGHVVRSQYVEGKGVPALIAVHTGSSKESKKIALAWAKGIGGTRAGVIQTTFKEECETDLFGEQAVLCGGASALVLAGFETLVEAGYQPEMAYFECLHELKLIVDLMVESGLSGMRFSVSETAEWGDYISGPRVINASSKKAMKAILKDIQTGKFTKNWVKEYQEGLPNYKQFIKDGQNHQIEKTGKRLRSLMPWVKKRNIKGAQAAYN